MKVTQPCPTLCNPVGYTVHGILQARILEWVAFSFSRGSSPSRDWTHISHIAGGFFTSWATREAPVFTLSYQYLSSMTFLRPWSFLHDKNGIKEIPNFIFRCAHEINQLTCRLYWQLNSFVNPLWCTGKTKLKSLLKHNVDVVMVRERLNLHISILYKQTCFY